MKTRGEMTMMKHYVIVRGDQQQISFNSLVLFQSKIKIKIHTNVTNLGYITFNYNEITYKMLY